MNDLRLSGHRGGGTRRATVSVSPTAGMHGRSRLLAALLATTVVTGVVKAGDPPPVVDSIAPAEIVQGQVPQPELTITGSNFVEGLPSATNRPTVTLRHVDGPGVAEFSTLAFVNFAGTVATVPPELMGLLAAPLGSYDVIVTRPDDESDTLPAAFSVTDGSPAPGEIALEVRSAWGGPVNDVEVVGDLAYAAIGRRLVILDVSAPSNPIEIGALDLVGVNDLAVRDGYAFVSANAPFRFSVVDVSNPSSPNLVWVAYEGNTGLGDVYLNDNLIYARSITGAVKVFEIADPENPVPLGEVVSSVASMAIVGDLLYVGTSPICCQADLKIYDLASDPLNPVLLGSVDNVGRTTRGLAVEGDYLVWTVRHEGDPANTSSLQVVDVSDPHAPAIVGSYDNGSAGEHILSDVAFSGGFAYVADGSGDPAKWTFTKGLLIFDIATDLANPTLVGTFKTHGDVTGVDVVGNRAYLHDAGEGLIILDISNPAEPVRLGNYHSPSTLRQMKKVGSLLYVADAWNGFTVLDVSDATAPQVVSVYLAEHEDDLGVDARGIDVQDDLVYLGAGHLGLEVVDVSDPGSPALVGVFRIPSAVPACSTFAAVTVWGDSPRYASIGFEEDFCGGVGGVFLNLDVTEPTNIFELGRVAHGPNGAARIELNESGIAFLGRGNSGFSENNDLVIDTSIPASPGVIYDGVVPAVADVALNGDVLYLASDHTGAVEPSPGLYIQDVTDPANPIVLVHVDENYPLSNGEGNLVRAYAVATQSQRVYVVGGGDGGALQGNRLIMFDTTDPEVPILVDVSSQPIGGMKSSVYVDEPFVYATNELTGPGSASYGLVISEALGLNPPGDLDGDGSVGILDFLLLLANWGPCADCGDCLGDIDGDCNVGITDFLLLLAAWG